MAWTVAVVLLASLGPAAVVGEVTFEAVSHAVAAGLGDERVVHRFGFVNAGDEPVTIAELRTSCGCTSATVAKRRYEPGEAGAVEVVFAFGDRVGPQRKRVEVVFGSDSDAAEKSRGQRHSTSTHHLRDGALSTLQTCGEWGLGARGAEAAVEQTRTTNRPQMRKTRRILQIASCFRPIPVASMKEK